MNRKTLFTLCLINGLVFYSGFFVGNYLTRIDIENILKRVKELEKHDISNTGEFEIFKKEFESRMDLIEEIFQQSSKIKAHIRESANIPEQVLNELTYNFFWNVRHSSINPQFVLAAMTQESSCNPFAVGKAGERGPLQVTYPIFLTYGKGSFFDWRDTMTAGFRFFEDLAKRTGGNKKLMLAYYNAGPYLPPKKALRIAGPYIKKVMMYYHKLCAKS